MADRLYLTAVDVIALHDEVMRETGSRSAVVRSIAVFESALARPEMVARYADASLTHQAALLAIGISQAQAFTDGNKRTAYLTALVFLRLNGSRFVGDQMELARWIEKSATDSGSDKRISDLAFWLGQHISPV